MHLFGQMRRRKLFRKKLQTCRFLHYASATNKYSSAQIERQTYQPSSNCCTRWCPRAKNWDNKISRSLLANGALNKNAESSSRSFVILYVINFSLFARNLLRKHLRKMLEELRENRSSTGGDLRKIWGNNRDRRILYIGIVRDARAEKKKWREKHRCVLCCSWKFPTLSRKIPAATIGKWWGSQEKTGPVLRPQRNERNQQKGQRNYRKNFMRGTLAKKKRALEKTPVIFCFFFFP